MKKEPPMAYLAKVALGEQIRITVKGQVVARLQADQDEAKEARERLLAYRAESVVGEVCESSLEDWQVGPKSKVCP